MTTALILIDIQNDYFANGSNPLLGSEEASEKARMILDDFRSNMLSVIHIQHLSLKPTATFFLPGTSGAEIHQNVKPFGNERVIVKHTPNSFFETDLLEYLRVLEVKRLVICGMMTHMCVDSTARAAKDLGFECILIGDACATKDLEVDGQVVRAQDVQNGFLAALSYYYSTVVTTKQFLLCVD
jgi:nicotinamidase-related amidase